MGYRGNDEDAISVAEFEHGWVGDDGVMDEIGHGRRFHPRAQLIGDE